MSRLLLSSILVLFAFPGPTPQSSSDQIMKLGWDGYSWRALDAELNGEEYKKIYLKAIIDTGPWSADLLKRDPVGNPTREGSPGIMLMYGTDWIQALNRFYGDSGNRHILVPDAMLLHAAKDFNATMENMEAVNRINLDKLGEEANDRTDRYVELRALMRVRNDLDPY